MLMAGRGEGLSMFGGYKMEGPASHCRGGGLERGQARPTIPLSVPHLSSGDEDVCSTPTPHAHDA